MALVVKNLPAKAGAVKDTGSIPGREDALEKGMETNSSILAWRIPMDKEAWWPVIHGVTKSRTQLID